MSGSERFTFFWGGPFSQWHKCAFTVDGVAYSSAEQYMMAQKATLFGDEAACARIMATRDPRKQKAIGRTVAGFNAARWEAAAQEAVYRANRAKFTADRDLLAQLLATRGTTLVEASPSDTIWGIGLAADDPAALDRATWRGTNLLGDILTRLRDELAGAGPDVAGPR